MTNKKLPISLVVLTYNEEVNIAACLESAINYVQDIFVVDSMSKDRTVQIAEQYTTKIYSHGFKNQADQFNWALDNLPIESDWILKLDADECMTKSAWEKLEAALREAPKEVSGYFMKRKFYFLGSWIRHGGYYPTWLLRVFRRGKGRSEERVMDEHLVVTEGEARMLDVDFIHDDKKDVSDWIAKHNNYSTREVSELLIQEDKVLVQEKLSGNQAERKRFMKNRVYYRAPMFLRAFGYFFYRYIVRLGFLDGVPGLMYHFLHGFWYRFLIDVKIFEARRR